MGRQVNETRTIDSTSYQTERQYDMAGRLEHIIYPDTSRTRYNYQYNGMGYLREVRKQGASYPYINIEDTDYNALGQIKNTHYGNGVNTAYAYYEDGSYRLKDITTTRNGTAIQAIHYEFDEAGNIEAMDVTTHTNAAYTVNHDFTYDALNRLKTATAICSNDQARAYSQGYNYDLAGNMTNKTGIGGWDVLTWESGVNKPRIRPKSVRFDAEVAGIAQRNVINNQDQKPTQITYQGNTTNLYYDGAGERIKKVKGAETVIYVGGIYEVRNGQAMSYIYANSQKIVTLTNNKEYYTHSDHLGSTGIVTDETGTVVEEIGYLPFGSTLFRNTFNGSTWESSYRFTGQEFDPEYHLYNYNARLYDPIMSRFITPDTIVPNPYNPQSLNRYTYCLNNPLIYVDPSGHFSFNDLLDWLVGFLGVPDPRDPSYAITFSPFEDEEGKNYGGGFTYHYPGGGGGVNYSSGNNNSNQYFDNQNTLITPQGGNSGGVNVGGSSGIYFNQTYIGTQKESEETNNRGPDFISLNLNFSPPNPYTLTFVGWTGTLCIDRYGNWYWSILGINVGKSASVLSGSIQANWLRRDTKPDEIDLNVFLSGHGFNVSAGSLVGISSTVSPGNGSATGIGVMIPLQIGGSYNYSFQGPGKLGIEW